jgi:transposase
MVQPHAVTPTPTSIIVGVDTHKYVHVAVAIDRLGARLGACSVSADRAGYQAVSMTRRRRRSTRSGRWPRGGSRSLPSSAPTTKSSTRLPKAAVPTLREADGIGADSAAEMMIVAGDNPTRLRSEAAFAKLCGACPIPASSGVTNRPRLFRGGHRQANAALYRVRRSA